MKDKIFAIILSVILLSVGSIYIFFSRTSVNQKEIAEKLIRFHVLANSDSDEDQNLKLKVRDEVLKYVSPKLKSSKSLDESRRIIKENDNKIREIAQKVIKEKQFNYNVSTTLSHENFPVKTYGNITLPQGNYEAYRIIIGEGEGHNWWCVMFPPLCFTDITKGEVSYKQTEKDMKRVLNNQEYKFVDNTVNGKQGENIVTKFKVVELIKNIGKKIQIN